MEDEETFDDFYYDRRTIYDRQRCLRETQQLQRLQEELRWLSYVENTYKNETTVRPRRSFCGRCCCIIWFILFITSIAFPMTTLFRLKEIAYDTMTSLLNSTKD